MACNCGKRKTGVAYDARSISRAFPGHDDNGMIELLTDPDCVTPYDGVFRQATVFVVGYRTEDEQLFKRADRGKALKLARESNLTLDQVPARMLCDSRMKELLGS